MSDGSVEFDIIGDDTDFKKTIEGLGNTTKKGMSGLGGVFKKGIQVAGKAVLGVAAATGAALGVTISKGMDRALDLDDAKSTLASLGYGMEEVGRISDDVLKSVKGTPYALNEAMGAAVSGLAAGVKEGEALTRYLSLIGDAAHVAKIPFNDMAAIFTKVQATGKVSGVILQQLGVHGVPILEWLATEYGVTAEEMTSMVSRGEVDAERFQSAIEQKVGGAALNAGETARGGFANVQAAVGRLGASLVDKLLPQAKEALRGLIGEIDALAPAFGLIGEGIADMLGGSMDEGSARVQEGLTEFVTKIMEFVMNALPMVVGVLGSLIGAVAAALPALIPPLVTAIVDAVLMLVDLLPTMIPLLLEAAVTLLMAIVDAIPQIISSLMDAAVNLVLAVADLLPTLVPVLNTAAIQLMIAIVDALPAIIPQLLVAVVQLVMALVKNLPTNIGSVSNAAVKLFFAIVKAVPTLTLNLVAAIADLIRAGINSFPKFMADFRNAGRDMIQGLIQGVTQGVGALVDAVKNAAKRALDAAKNLLGIKSPSRVFRDAVGKQIMTGWAEGIDGNARGLIASVKDTAASLVDAAATPNLYASLAAAPAGGYALAGMTPRAPSGRYGDSSSSTTIYQVGDVRIPSSDPLAQQTFADLARLVRRYSRMGPGGM